MKTIARFLVALAALWPVSCARREAPPAFSETLYRHLEGDPPTLDPTTTNEEIGLRVEQMLFRPLIGIDRERRYVPALAASWTASPDGLAFDFRLDPAARWEDGTPVTSQDVAFTIDRVRDPKVPALNWRWGFEDVVAVETPEATRAVVRFREPYAQRLLAFNLPIVSRAAFARTPGSADRQPFASGPYRLESWEANQKLTLVRRADQPAEAYPFERIVFRVIPDGAVRFRAGTRGELDEFRISRDQRGQAERSAEFAARNRILKAPQFSVVIVVWSCRNPILADVRVRRALARAWPRAETARRLYVPEGAALISGPYPAGAHENAPDVAPPPFDPAESARLLDEAGLPMGRDGIRRQRGRRASIEFVYPPGERIYTNIGEILREAYGKAGIELVLRPLDWAAFAQRFTAGEFDVIPTANTFLPPNLDPYPFYHSSMAPPKGQNSGFYASAEADRAMEAARRELDDGRRLELYRQIHRLLAADPPADFLWSAEQYWGLSKRLEGVESSPLGLFHFLPGPLGWRPAARRG
ncbi:MAG: ABC transporter substrate-binding protein [Thermoanaerobaculia bacterium]